MEILSNATFTCERVDGAVPTFNITWTNRNIDIIDIKKIGGVVNNSTDYGALSSKTLNMLRTHTTLDKHQIASARSALLKNKIIGNHNRMNLLVARIVPEYETDGILAISRKYDFPPLNLLRGILLRKGYNTSKLHDIFVSKTNAANVLSAYDMQQYVAAEANDAESMFDQQMITDIAAANELAFVNYFRSLGITLKDENELAAEQIESHGRMIATPDILFIDTVFINGTQIAWLDYKDYIGTNVRFLYMSNVKQAHEYEERWGQGAICYHYGFIAGMTIPGAMLLDAHALPIKLQNKDVSTSIRINVIETSESKTSKSIKVNEVAGKKATKGSSKKAESGAKSKAKQKT